MSVSKLLHQPAPARDGVFVGLVGLVVRLLTVVWAAPRIPPTADGAFYHVIAKRIANGDGYTWLWPDGAVTYAAHYPVGYPALVGGMYALFGVAPWAAMTCNAALGAGAVWAVHRLARTATSRAGALFAAGSVALHPALVLYTPALMTEGVTAALWALAAAVAVVVRDDSLRVAALRLTLVGLLVGLATLIRPQSVLLAPALGWVAAPRGAPWLMRASRAAAVTAVAVVSCLPWTARNCARMDRCVFISANAGWNLLIGAAERADGGWIPIERAGVPPDCADVFGEAAKDACYGRAALANISKQPLRWLALAPRKLAVTFDYAGAAGWYLNAANPEAFPQRRKVMLGVVESVWQRGLLGLSLLCTARLAGPRPGARRLLAALAALALFSPPAWIAYLGLVGSALLLGRRLADHLPAALAVAAVAATALAHAVFFGSGRYSLVVMPLVAALAGCALSARAAEPVFDRDAGGG